MNVQNNYELNYPDAYQSDVSRTTWTFFDFSTLITYKHRLPAHDL